MSPALSKMFSPPNQILRKIKYLGGRLGPEKKYLAPPPPKKFPKSLQTTLPAPPPPGKPPPSHPGIFNKKPPPLPSCASDSPFPLPEQKKIQKYPIRPPRYSFTAANCWGGHANAIAAIPPSSAIPLRGRLVPRGMWRGFS